MFSASAGKKESEASAVRWCVGMWRSGWWMDYDVKDLRLARFKLG